MARYSTTMTLTVEEDSELQDLADLLPTSLMRAPAETRRVLDVVVEASTPVTVTSEQDPGGTSAFRMNQRASTASVPATAPAVVAESLQDIVDPAAGKAREDALQRCEHLSILLTDLDSWKQRELGQLAAQATALRSELVEMEALLQQEKIEAREIEDTISRLEQEAAALQALAARNSMNVATCTQNLQTKTAELQVLQGELQALNNAIAALEQDIESMGTEITDLRAQVIALTTRKAELESLIREVQQAIEGLRESLQVLTGQKSLTEQEIGTLDQDIYQRETHLADLSMQIERLTSTCNALEADAARLGGQHQGLQQDLERTSQQAHAAKVTETRIQNELAQAEREEAIARAELQRLEGELHGLQSQIDSLHASAQRERARGDCHCAMYYERAAEAHRGRLQTLQQQVSTHRSRANGRAASLRVQSADASRERQQLDSAVGSLQAEGDRVQKALVDTRTQYNSTLTQLQGTRSSANTERETQQQSQTRRLALQWDHSTITHNIAMRERELSRTNAQLSRTTQDLASAQERLNTRFSELNAAESRRQLLSVERQNKQDAQVEKEREVGAAKSAHQEAKLRLQNGNAALNAVQRSLQDNTEGREVNKQCLATREHRLALTQQKVRYAEDRQVQVQREHANSLRNLTQARAEAECELLAVERSLEQRYPHLRFPQRSQTRSLSK